MLLAILPEGLRRDVVGSRNVSAVSILYRLYVVFQPGGGAERSALLKSLTDVRVGSNIQDVLATIRLWRRWVARALELKVAVPDPLILMQVLSKMSETLGKLGGAQVTYRLAAVRQELQVDQRPNLPAVQEYAEFLQAEAEDLSLMAGASKVSSSAAATSMQSSANGATAVPAVKAVALANGGGSDEKAKPQCRYWGTSAGCRRGDSCTYSHSWEGLSKDGRCYGCSGEGHMKKDCPYRQKDGGAQKNPKVSKVKTSSKEKESPEKTKGESAVGKSEEPTPSPTPLRTSTSVVEDVKSDGGSGKPQSDPTATFMNEAAVLLKSLRSLKAVKLKQVSMNPDDSRRVALLDGGATHGLRTAEPGERHELEPVQVELAAGSTWLYRHRGHRTLLSLEEVEPILPLHRVISLGYKLEWSRKGCRIHHPERGIINCIMRGGCPTMDREEGLALLKEMEIMDAGGMGLKGSELQWWKDHFPTLPDRVLHRIQGQGEEWNPEALPWNRHQRRAHLRRGVAFHLFCGPDAKKWKQVQGDYEWIFVDTCHGSQFDLHRPAVWSYLWWLAERGMIRIIIGGPPCRSVSRLRDGPPGPRRVRGRGIDRYGLESLTEVEQELVDGDTSLMVKQVALWTKAEEVRSGRGLETGFLLETPQDPATYLPDQEGLQHPSFLEFPELCTLLEEDGMELISFDQGAMGHQRRKPTSIITNLPGLVQLRELRGGGQSGSAGDDLQERIRTSRTWAAWSPGLVAAIVEALRIRTHLEAEMESKDPAELKKLDLEAWKRHVKMQHRPYRRDCRRCLEMMGTDGHHRRTPGDSSSYTLNIDIVGPFPVALDVGTGEKAKYMLVSTVAIPRIPLEGLEDDTKDALEIAEDDDALPLPDVVERDPVEKASDEEVKALNQKWLEHVKHLSEPVGVQNITLVEPLASRHRDDVIKVASRLYCRYRAMGVCPIRIHTDRETAFLSKPFQAWAKRMVMFQTMTGGDEGPGNGRIESEVQQVKRRVRLLVRESGLGEGLWPCVARHVGEERLRMQLEKLGIPTKPLLPLGARMSVKTKRWHRAGFGPLVAPFRTMTVMGPSPLMSTGYVMKDGDQVQHSRLVVATDPNADRAVMELQAIDHPERPSRRFTGKQPPDPLLPQVPQPIQHPDDHLLDPVQRREGAEGDVGPGGAEGDAGLGGAQGGGDGIPGPGEVLDEHGNVLPFWGDPDASPSCTSGWGGGHFGSQPTFPM